MYTKHIPGILHLINGLAANKHTYQNSTIRKQPKGWECSSVGEHMHD
jgi:hypothetical protein